MALNRVNLRSYHRDIENQVYANERIELIPISGSILGVDGDYNVSGETLQKTTDATGSILFSGLPVGQYKLLLHPGITSSFWLLSIPTDTTGSINSIDYTVTSVTQSNGTFAYSQASSDARYYQKTHTVTSSLSASTSTSSSYSLSSSFSPVETLDVIGNPVNNKTFSCSNKSIAFSFTAPNNSPSYDGAFEVEATGNYSGDLLHVHQHTGNPSAVVDLVHLESESSNVNPLHISSSATCSIHSNKPIRMDFVSSSMPLLLNSNCKVAVTNLVAESASYASSALSASHALIANTAVTTSYVQPLTNNLEVTGTLGVNSNNAGFSTQIKQAHAQGYGLKIELANNSAEVNALVVNCGVANVLNIPGGNDGVANIDVMAFQPSQNAYTDLGGGSYKFKDIYISGQLYGTASLATSATNATTSSHTSGSINVRYISYLNNPAATRLSVGNANTLTIYGANGANNTLAEFYSAGGGDYALIRPKLYLGELSIGYPVLKAGSGSVITCSNGAENGLGNILANQFIGTASRATYTPGEVPVGTVLDWLKSFTGTPSLAINWVECNGQVISASQSPFSGSTLPNLNNNLFTMGATGSGLVSGSSTHNHNIDLTTNQVGVAAGTDFQVPQAGNYSSNTVNHLPPYYSVVKIIRIY